MRATLEQLANDVIEKAPIFSAKMKKIENIKCRYKKLIEEESRLKDQIFSEETFLNTYESSIELIEQSTQISKQRFFEAKQHFIDAVMKNVSLSMSNNATPLIFQGIECSGMSPLIQDTRIRSYFIQKKAEILKKIDHLYQLQRNTFCIDQNYDDLYLINQSNNYNPNVNLHYLIREYKTERLSSKIEKTITKQETDSNNYSLISDSIDFINSEISNNLIPPPLPQNEAIDVDGFPMISHNNEPPKDVKTYCDHFIKMISNDTGINDIIEHIESTIKELSLFFSKEKSILSEALKTFYYNNPTWESKKDKLILQNSIISKTQNQIQEAQNIIFLLEQTVLPPETKIISEGNHIISLLKELRGLFDKIYNCLSRKKIIRSDISINIPMLESFEIDEISYSQIERCNKIIDEIKPIFKSNLDLQASFLGGLNNLIATSRDVHDMRAKMDMHDIEISTPIEIDDSEKRQRFLKLKESVLQKQSEQLNAFRESFETLSDKLLKSVSKETNQDNEFKSKENQGAKDIKNVFFDKKIIEFKPIDTSLNVKPQKSNPFLDSNQNLIEKINNRNQDFVQFSPVTINFDEYKYDDKHYQSYKNILNDLSDEIKEENLDEMIDQRNKALHLYKQMKQEKEMKIQQEAIKKRTKIDETQKIKDEKDRHIQLLEEFNFIQSKLNDANESLQNLKQEINSLVTKKQNLESIIHDNNLNATMYENYCKMIEEIEEENQKLIKEQEEQENSFTSVNG